MKTMKTMKYAILLSIGVMIFSASAASAAIFAKTGTIARTLSSASQFSGCMIQLDVSISNGCPDNGWVSLDCDGDSIGVDVAKRNYATALIAFTTDTPVTVYIDNSLITTGNFCTVTRLDLRK